MGPARLWDMEQMAPIIPTLMRKNQRCVVSRSRPHGDPLLGVSVVRKVIFVGI